MALIFIAVLGVYQLLLFFVHAVVYQTLVAAFGWTWAPLGWIFALLSLFFVTASFLTYRFCNGPVKWYYRFSAYWFGLIHFLFIGGAAFFFLEYAIYRHGGYVAPTFLGIICFGIMFLIHSYATWQTQLPKFTRVTIKLPHLPDFWKNKKVIFVSDVHLGAVWGKNFSQKVVTKIKSESPDAVFIGGDIFDGVKCHAKSLLDPFISLRPPEGIYYVSGNHEYIEDTDQLLGSVRDAGLRILKNEMIDLRGIQLVGVDWKDTQHADTFEKVLKEMAIDPNKPSILLRHEPSHLPVAEKAGISLELSGHTHAGQIFPLSYITHRVYRGFDYGLKKLGNMWVYTSSGVGTWGPPLRFGTKAEILLISFE